MMELQTVFVIAGVLGTIPAGIAQNKGHSLVLWWVYGTAMFLIAFPHALLVKDAQP